MYSYFGRDLNFEQKGAKVDIGSDIIHNLELLLLLVYHEPNLNILVAEYQIFVLEYLPPLPYVELGQLSLVESFVDEPPLWGFEQIDHIEVHLLTFVLL